jgi:hypothetical protein
MFKLKGWGNSLLKWLTILHVVSLPFVLVSVWVLSYYTIDLWINYWGSVIEVMESTNMTVSDQMILISSTGAGLTVAMAFMSIVSLIMFIVVTYILYKMYGGGNKE